MNAINELPKWQLMFRSGFAPLLSTKALEALRDGLEKNDERLVQGITCVPPAIQGCKELPPQQACALAYAGWHGERIQTVGALEEWFAEICLSAQERVKWEVKPSDFLSFFDDTPKELMSRYLLQEVNWELAMRRAEVSSVQAT